MKLHSHHLEESGLSHDSEAEVVETSSGIGVREAGRKGGIATRDRHGVEFYRQIGAKGGESTKKLYAHLFSEFGKKGGRPRRPSLNKPEGEKNQ